tara:strand:- start:16 stop:627 length:612 start_codon:yes stop_codon:yes gene_type:complete
MKGFDCFRVIVSILLVLLSLELVAENTINNEKKNILGNFNAPNTLIEYASLSCVHCATFHNQKLPEIKEKLIKTGKLQYIYKDFPLDMPAMLAAMVTNCYEGEQFHTILNTLFRNQKKWVSSSSNKEELLNAFHQILKQHGISLKKIKTCAEENEYNKKKWDTILASRLEGQKLGVNSTPSFFLNGKKLEGSVDLKRLLKHIY